MAGVYCHNMSFRGFKKLPSEYEIVSHPQSLRSVTFGKISSVLVSAISFSFSTSDIL